MAKTQKRGENQGAEVSSQAERMERDLSGIRRAMRSPLDAEVSKGKLTVPQKAAMHTIVHGGGISLKDLSRELNLAHSTVSGIVDRLEKRGLVERKPDEKDGRVSRIYPTSVVKEFIKERIPMLSRGPLEGALLRATPGERTALEHAVKRLRELLEQTWVRN